MLGKTVRWIASHPWIYDQIQLLAGARTTYKRLSSRIDTFNSTLVLDLGGGTGLYRHVWPNRSTYLCLDIDSHKLGRFRKKNTDCGALLADATCIPIKESCVDAVVCISMSHHLSDESLMQLIRESVRVLKPKGTLLFQDAVWAPSRWPGRLLWKYDRGSYPRSVEHLHSIISQQYHIIYSEQYAIYHKYVLYRGVKDINARNT